MEVREKGLVSMDSIEIGDYVRTGKDRFSRVFSFGHIDHDAEVDYLQIFVGGLEIPLEVTAMHLIFVNDRMRPASVVRVGDILGEDRVSNVKTVKRLGLYAPFTESGDIIVSGILASSYIQVLDHSLVDQHFASHAALAPRRLVCAFDFAICENEKYTDGISNFVFSLAKVAERIQARSAVVQVVVSLVVFPFVVALYWLEQFICSPLIICSLIIGAAIFYKKAKKFHAKSL